MVRRVTLYSSSTRSHLDSSRYRVSQSLYQSAPVYQWWNNGRIYAEWGSGSPVSGGPGTRGPRPRHLPLNALWTTPGTGLDPSSLTFEDETVVDPVYRFDTQDVGSLLLGVPVVDPSTTPVLLP